MFYSKELQRRPRANASPQMQVSCKPDMWESMKNLRATDPKPLTLTPQNDMEPAEGSEGI